MSIGQLNPEGGVPYVNGAECDQSQGNEWIYEHLQCVIERFGHVKLNLHYQNTFLLLGCFFYHSRDSFTFRPTQLSLGNLLKRMLYFLEGISFKNKVIVIFFDQPSTSHSPLATL